MLPIIENAVIPFSAAFFGNAGAKILNPVLTSFDNWFYYTFGYKNDLKRQKKEKDVNYTLDKYSAQNMALPSPIFSEDSLRIFKIEIIEELRKIEEKDIQLPNKTKLGFFFENSRFFIEEEEIRKVYARLIAQTADRTKEAYVHKSFGKILTELAPDEVKILEYFKISSIYVAEKYSYNALSFRKEMDIQELYNWEFQRPKVLDTVPELEDIFSMVFHIENNFLNNSITYIRNKESLNENPLDDFEVMDNSRFIDVHVSLSVLERLNLIEYTPIDKNITMFHELFYDVIARQEKIKVTSFENVLVNGSQNLINNDLFITSAATPVIPSFYEFDNNPFLFEINPIIYEYSLTSFGKNFLKIIG
ncbi:Abi-alpha family protein [Enterococcus hulanensis]|uniref:Abi-alpha family protein n=1 Tax=Enterococcus hulanensis TaxID=2559929 RepID=A0ABU3F347_9ENTE|nr:Abi-alpha family protein [Enterococcus hulanensis]MDT2600948.1 Abi-alpha family protein [Enterococcus hulanensis]MDT2611536.1 Abi-alpha family protein [Enterococcus hulanensis]MDT2617979.1 Abi-alpha family protein [Enterococcus hulanensis]MDT2628982.1 Abi-alpha family protein [Enterococcus hulanensis]MDT2656544.1 Abi-alpha family protein [Enterococcus hulanensis]